MLKLSNPSKLRGETDGGDFDDSSFCTIISEERSDDEYSNIDCKTASASIPSTDAGLIFQGDEDEDFHLILKQDSPDPPSVGDDDAAAGSSSSAGRRKKTSTAAQMVCPHCSKTFPSHWKLVDHLGVHTNEKRFECNLCQKRFIRKRELVQHLRVFHVETPNYECSICNRKFMYRTSLTQHLKMHSNEKPPPAECSICQKTYAHKESLASHFRKRHIAYRKYCCSTCDKKCRYPSDLSIHCCTFTKEKPFDCTQCARSFSSRNGFKQHAIRVHGGLKNNLGQNSV